MLCIIDYILDLYLLEWLLYLQQEFDDCGEAGVIIKHPDNTEIELDISILKDLDTVGIWIIKTSEADIEIDFSGFDYVFKQNEMKSLKQFLLSFRQTAIVGSKPSIESN